ncbi:hypothetical protein NUU61_006932 [Penicillium alfredii]|uniref:Uncharacterized protein n=1 Tax=Penicillium alfredii TaxID=1506179 RepID=A0A9W9F202_9EURO|nr:uncharacterized protein NUU61_006932 [Penicillium alfredii]KAJ5092062.1 hypothetical protein NUU61_006932 [Penicillium alfredii]
MTMRQEKHRAPVILRSSEDWPKWSSRIQSIAELHAVWQYCNPSTRKKDLPVDEEPIKPTVKSVRPSATGLIDLSTDDFTVLASLVSAYKATLAAQRSTQWALQSMQDLIRDSVACEHQHYIADAGSAWEQMVALAAAFQPPSLQQLQDDWDHLHVVGSVSSIQTYLGLWQALFAKCRRLDLVNTSQAEALFESLAVWQDPDSQ